MQTKAFNAEIRLFPLKGACNAVLGMHNKKIQDSSITASSQLSLNHVPSLARLDSVQGAWCSAPTDNLPYIEILLSEEKFLTLIKTQGSKKDLRWATKYEIQYQKDGQWIVYRKTDGTRVSNKQTNKSCLLFHPNIGILQAQWILHAQCNMYAQRSTYGSSDKRNYSQVSTMYWKTSSPLPHSLLPHSPKAELLRDKITTLRESDLSLNWVSHIFSNRDVVMNFMNKKYYRVSILSFDTQTFDGNVGVTSLNAIALQPRIRTRSVRIYPKFPLSLDGDASLMNVSCLRLELYGCSAPG